MVDKCLYDSPSALWWIDWKAHGGQVADLEVHIDRNADYDGLAVAWGIGNTKLRVEECGEACRAHKPNPDGGEQPSPGALTWMNIAQPGRAIRGHLIL